MHAHRILARLTTLALLAYVAAAYALPITLRDSNGTRYNVNTDVSPDAPTSLASGARYQVAWPPLLPLDWRSARLERLQPSLATGARCCAPAGRTCLRS